jgi:hypothetical protein
MKLIYDSPSYKVRGHVIPSGTGELTLELYTEHPQAQHPRMQRVLQLTTDRETLADLGCWLIDSTYP